MLDGDVVVVVFSVFVVVVATFVVNVFVFFALKLNFLSENSVLNVFDITNVEMLSSGSVYC